MTDIYRPQGELLVTPDGKSIAPTPGLYFASRKPVLSLAHSVIDTSNECSVEFYKAVRRVEGPEIAVAGVRWKCDKDWILSGDEEYTGTRIVEENSVLLATFTEASGGAPVWYLLSRRQQSQQNLLRYQYRSELGSIRVPYDKKENICSFSYREIESVVGGWEDKMQAEAHKQDAKKMFEMDDTETQQEENFMQKHPEIQRIEIYKDTILSQPDRQKSKGRGFVAGGQRNSTIRGPGRG